MRTRRDYKYDVYTSLSRDVSDKFNQMGRRVSSLSVRDTVGLTDGVADCELDLGSKLTREKKFPLVLARKGLDVTVESTKASFDDDRKHILNAIAGRRVVNARSFAPLAPRVADPAYDTLDTTLRGRFLASVWRRLLELAMMLETTKALQRLRMEKYACMLRVSRLRKFEASFHNCNDFNDEQAALLADALPETLETLDLYLQGASMGRDGTRRLFGAMSRLPKLSVLRFQRVEHAVLDRTALADALKCHGALTSLSMSNNELTEKATIEIVQAARQQGKITHLALATCSIGNTGASEIAAYIRESSVLKFIDMRQK